MNGKVDDLISREKARNKIVSLMKEMKLTSGDTTVWQDFIISPTEAVHALIWMPSADAVEVIRCRECEYYKGSASENRKVCFRKDIDGLPVCYEFEPNDFCSYGKREEE